MQGLEAALTRKDPEAKIFLAPRSWGFWLPELAREIAEATAFVLLVGEKGLGPWQVIECYEALDRRVKQHDFPIVLVLLDGQPAPGLPFLRQLHWIISADPASEKSIQVMDAAAGGGALPGELWRHTAPYRGLAAMTEADTDFFLAEGARDRRSDQSAGSDPRKTSGPSRQSGCRKILAGAGGGARRLYAAGMARNGGAGRPRSGARARLQPRCTSAIRVRAANDAGLERRECPAR
jgi:hypothetical protein